MSSIQEVEGSEEQNNEPQLGRGHQIKQQSAHNRIMLLIPSENWFLPLVHLLQCIPQLCLTQ